ncbi:MAG: efflux RND transporter periplasmic adaptor subunit, partial [Phycisphaerae bacterium]
RSRMAQAQARLSKAEEDVVESREDVQRRRKQVAACTIRAPAPGLVVYSSSEDFYMGRGRGGGGSSSSNIDEGETVYERQKIITLPDTSEMIAEIAVHESSVDMVRPGQRANIVIDAFPDKIFQGEVLKIATLPDPRRGFMNPDLKVYTTQVSIEGTHDFLKPGMSAKVGILVEQLRDVLIVPIQVVANRAGRKVCYVATPEGPQEREVQTGAFNDTFVQIIDGLQAGDEVLLNPPRVTEASSEQRLPEEQREPLQDKEQPQDREEEQPRDRELPQGIEPPQDRQLELTDEIIDRIMGRMAENNPERAKELQQLRQSDPEKFKAELTRFMQTMRERMRQGTGSMGRRPGDAEPGQNRSMRRRPGDAESEPDR